MALFRIYSAICSKRSTIWIPTGSSFLTTADSLGISTTYVFIRKLPIWKNGTRKIGRGQCWLVIIGLLSEIHFTSISDWPKEIECPMQIKVFLTFNIICVHLYIHFSKVRTHNKNTVTNPIDYFHFGSRNFLKMCYLFSLLFIMHFKNSTICFG